MKHQLITSDIMNWLNLARRYGYRQNYYHAMLLDPPYHLTSVVKRFGKGEPTHTKTYADMMGRKTPIGRLARGFMGQTWDGGDLAFNPELWAALKGMLLPGAFCFAFAGSRGWHRMATAIEDAGFIMHPTIFLWAYGSGFPKATRIDTQIQPKNNQELVGIDKSKYRKDRDSLVYSKHVGQTGELRYPTTPEAAQWEGHRYGLQAIKPATEPILCFQKPYEGRPLDNITETGAGALNIDGGRIGTDEAWKGKNNGHPESVTVYGDGLNHVSSGNHPKGRWPSNLLLQHSPDCKKVGVKRVKPGNGSGIVGDTTNSPKTMNVYSEYKGIQQKGFTYTDPDGKETVADWQCVDECAVRKLGEQSGELSTVGGPKKTTHKDGMFGIGQPGRVYKDEGTAARFFYQSHFAYEIAEQIAASDPVRYVAKAGNKERNAGLDGLLNQMKHRVNSGGLENEPRWSPVETKNIHPTVKPIALTKYLASLLLPPEAYEPRRILVPFAGSGSEMIGAMLAGWDEITGIEMTKKYIPIAKARLEWWAHYLKWGQDDIDIILDAIHEDENEQLSFIKEIQ